jgi:hypothetical protein
MAATPDPPLGGRTLLIIERNAGPGTPESGPDAKWGTAWSLRALGDLPLHTATLPEKYIIEGMATPRAPLLFQEQA